LRPLHRSRTRLLIIGLTDAAGYRCAARSRLSPRRAASSTSVPPQTRWWMVSWAWSPPRLLAWWRWCRRLMSTTEMSRVSPFVDGDSSSWPSLWTQPKCRRPTTSRTRRYRPPQRRDCSLPPHRSPGQLPALQPGRWTWRMTAPAVGDQSSRETDCTSHHVASTLRRTFWDGQDLNLVIAAFAVFAGRSRVPDISRLSGPSIGRGEMNHIRPTQKVSDTERHVN
jgi:hypothetical protein